MNFEAGDNQKSPEIASLTQKIVEGELRIKEKTN